MNPLFGATFVPLQGGDLAETYKLGELKPENCNIDEDLFLVLSPEDKSTDHAYAYFTKALGDQMAADEGADPGTYDFLVGWWDVGADGFDIGDDTFRADNVDIPIGSAFLGLFESGENIKLTSSGQVPAAPRPISTDRKLNPSFSNYLPRTIKLGWVQASGCNIDEDLFLVLNPDDKSTDHAYAYFTKELGDAMAADEGSDPGTYDFLVGWWDVGADGFDIGDDSFRADNVDVQAGDAFLGLCESGENVTITIPSAFYNGESK